MGASDEWRRRHDFGEPIADGTTTTTRWRLDETKGRRQDGRQDDDSNRLQEGDGDAWRHKRDVRMATTTMTITRDVMTMTSGARRKDGDDDHHKTVKIGRWQLQQQDGRDRTMTTTVAGTSRQYGDDDDSRIATPGLPKVWKWHLQYKTKYWTPAKPWARTLQFQTKQWTEIRSWKVDSSI